MPSTRRDLLAMSALAVLAGVGMARPTADRPSSGRPAARMPSPTASLVTRWDTDPWARGGYSALPPGVRPGVRRQLAERLIAGRIALAGEYCDHAYPATVPGALRSGRAAARLLADEGPSGTRVIVIGAGMAGLAAATDLARWGADVTVVEASDRLGGRIRTDRSWGVPVEEGAAWLHGIGRNPALPLVRRAGLGTVATDYDDGVVRNAASGRRDPVAAARAEDLVRLLAELERASPPVGLSVGQWLAGRGWNAREAGGAEDWAVQTEIVQEFGRDPEALGVAALAEGAWLRGGDAFVTGGYDAVPRMLASELDVRRSTPVVGVEASRSSVVVTAADGSRVTADAVVVAVPLALLQAGLPRLTPWPQAVSRSVAALRTGLLEKVALAFDEPWWRSEGDEVTVIGVAGARWSEWYDITEVTGRPSLVGFCGGSAARRRPTLDPACVAEAVVGLASAYALTLQG